jgi:integrase
MRPLKHLPKELWPAEDRRLFQLAYLEGDIFDDEPSPGRHLAAATRNSIYFGWRRWLGFLHAHHPDDLLLGPAERITAERVRAYVEHLRADLSSISVATLVSQLYHGACLIASECDWSWLRALKTRLHALAEPQDRFKHLVPAHHTLDLGMKLMDTAFDIPLGGRKAREVQYRDGLILAIMSLWPIRRRSIAALTVGHHLRLDAGTARIKLSSEDTKAKRAEYWTAPDALDPYLARYIREIRPRLLRGADYDALWPSLKGGPLRGDAIYTMVRRRTANSCGKAMALHDFRRSAATFLAMDAPEKVGLIPGVLQHTGPEVGQQIYNLARSTNASRRHVAAVTALKAQLRGAETKP